MHISYILYAQRNPSFETDTNITNLQQGATDIRHKEMENDSIKLTIRSIKYKYFFVEQRNVLTLCVDK